MTASRRRERFQQLIMPHLYAAYRTARWLGAGSQDAEDIVQDASLRAYRFIDQLNTDRPKAWFLAIVRRAAIDAHAKGGPMLSIDDPAFGDGEAWLDAIEPSIADHAPDAEALVIERQTADHVHAAMAHLPGSMRLILLLREIEGMSYGEIATALEIPLGTVMSRLTRARNRLKEILVSGGWQWPQ